MKLSWLLVVLFLISTALQAQKKAPRYIAEIYGGPSIPVGQFADKAYSLGSSDKEPSGLAVTGYAVNASVGYYVKKSIGIMLMGGISVNPQTVDPYIEYFKQVISTTSTIKANANKWKAVKIMAGGFYSKPLGSLSKCLFVTKLAAGVCKTAVPGYSYSFYNQTGLPYSFGEVGKMSLPWAFCYQAGAGLQFNLNKMLHIVFDVSYFNAKPKNKFEYTSFPSPGGLIATETKYSLASVNALAGVGIKL
jgi:hypothetical protein